jgi:hypothetical protein
VLVFFARSSATATKTLRRLLCALARRQPSLVCYQYFLRSSAVTQDAMYAHLGRKAVASVTRSLHTSRLPISHPTRHTRASAVSSSAPEMTASSDQQLPAVYKRLVAKRTGASFADVAEVEQVPLPQPGPKEVQFTSCPCTYQQATHPSLCCAETADTTHTCCCLFAWPTNACLCPPLCAGTRAHAVCWYQRRL